MSHSRARRFAGVSMLRPADHRFTRIRFRRQTARYTRRAVGIAIFLMGVLVMLARLAGGIAGHG